MNRLVLTLLCHLITTSCVMSQKRSEVPMQIDSKNRVIKTFDGYIYRVYDVLGRLIENYGNPKRDDDNRNYHTYISYSENESVITVKTYLLEDNNLKCVIKPNSRYHIEKYIQNKDGITFELYQPIFDAKGKVIDHRLVEKSETDFVPYKKVRAPIINK
jgi:hypothetical protein